jgi:hypothetical protein
MAARSSGASLIFRPSGLPLGSASKKERRNSHVVEYV